MTHDVRMSKRLSLWLRHRPKAAGLSLDAQGWADTSSVLAALQAAGLPSTHSALMAVVAANDKQRFGVSEDSARIRARQGHSVPVHLQWPAATPPMLLYHGTVERFLASIMAQGLQRMGRHHVHLSPDVVLLAASHYWRNDRMHSRRLRVRT